MASAIERAWATDCDEVIVADGGSTDGTIEICQGCRCRVITSEPGRGTQMNAGARAATSDLLLFLHADNWLVKNGCQQIRALGPQAENMFGGFRQRIDDERGIFRWIERGNAWRIRWRGLVYGDQAFFVRRSLFESLGGFPDIPLMEDLSFSMKLKAVGRPVILSGPTFVGARRWQENGAVIQTLRNWFLGGAFMVGASPNWLAKRYRRHDAKK